LLLTGNESAHCPKFQQAKLSSQLSYIAYLDNFKLFNSKFVLKPGQQPQFDKKQLWTAGRDISECPGKFQWCSTKLQDFLKDVLVWKNDKPNTIDSCVYLDLNQAPGSFENPKLATDDCHQKKYFVCEVKQKTQSNKTDNSVNLTFFKLSYF